MTLGLEGPGRVLDMGSYRWGFVFFAGGIRFRESWLIMEYVMPISAIVGVYFTGGMRLRVLVEYVRRFQ